MANTEISKKASCSSLSAEEISTIFNALKSVFEPLEKRQFNPMIVNNEKEVEKLKMENPDKKYKSKEDVLSKALKASMKHAMSSTLPK